MCVCIILDRFHPNRTGLSYADTTPRDGHALVWLMEHGASQHAIAEFGHARLTSAQRDVLSTALHQVTLHISQHILAYTRYSFT